MSIQSLSPESFHTFGDLLKFLRRRERLTQLELSVSIGYSEAQIGRLEHNQRKPDLTAVQALFIPALHLEDEPDFTLRLLELARTARQEDTPAPGYAPYKGLLFFDQSDAGLFFGREALTTHLTERVADIARDASSRFLAVVGASGSGKSSLVRAGLAVALQRLGWEIHTFTPTADPLKRLADSYTLPGENNGQNHLVLVDQFEETFTLCRDENERSEFIERLMAVARGKPANTTVVIALRADFYSHCAQYPLLRAAVAAAQEYIGQMTKDELRRAIEEPAKRGGWEFEPGLVDILLSDIGADGIGQPEPGALPLLSHTLLATWERRRGRTFTFYGYHASGGVRGAIAETAESVFTDQLNQDQQELAHDIFLRLTELGEGTEDTRRRVTLNELAHLSEQAIPIRVVLNKLAEARLITLNEDTAEVAHEALIREWQRLHEWLSQDRQGLLLHRHLTDVALEWESRERDPVELYRGARLAQAREWASANEGRLNAAEREFLAASIEQEQHGALEREAQRQRELDAAQKLAEAEQHRAEEQGRSAQRLRRRALYLSLAVVIAFGMTLAAITFGRQASRNASLASQNMSAAQSASTQAVAQQSTAESASLLSQAQKAIAQAASTQAVREVNLRATSEANTVQESNAALEHATRSEALRLAAEANSLMLGNGDMNLIALLAIRSLNKQFTLSGDAVLTSLQAPPREFRGHTADLWGVAFSPDGKYLATGSDDQTARLWDVATGQTIRIFSGHTGAVGEVVFSPDGNYLATAATDQTARLWDIASGLTVQVFSGHSGGVDSVAFSPDGKYLITNGGGDNTARLWEVSTGQTLQVFASHTADVVRVAFSNDGKHVLSGSVDGTVRLWDAAMGRQVRIFEHPSTPCGSAVAFSPDDKYIAAGCEDNMTRLWEVATGDFVREFFSNGFVAGVRFSPDGRFLLTGGDDFTARLWDLAAGQTSRLFTGHGNAVQTVTFSPDGRLVATASNDGIARIWNLQTFPGGMQFTGHGAPVVQASFSPDGKQIVTAGEDGSARIWDAATGQTLITLIGHTDITRGAVFSADGKLVLTASGDSTARIWDTASGKELRRFIGHTALVNRAVFSQDGKYVVTTSFDGTARVWDAQTAQTIVIYRNQGPGYVNRVAFSPDGKTVVTSGDDGTARLWDPLTGQELMVFIGHTADVRGVAFSPDGKYLTTGSVDGSVRLWDLATGKEVRRFAGHPGGVDSVAFSPDGKYLVSSGVDATARLWDVQTGQEVRRFTGHTKDVGTVVFSPDGKYILTSSRDNTARLWLINLQDNIRAVCAVLARDLKSDERLKFDITDQTSTCPAP